MTAKLFVLRFTGTLGFLLLFIAAFNRLVDPFWYFGDPKIEGFNAVKSQFRFYEHDIKPAFLVRQQPEAVIFGSSYSEVGFDPNNPDFSDRDRFKTMNFGLIGSQWDKVQCAFEFAVAHAPIKRALVEIAPTAMPKADCKKAFPHTGQMELSELLLSNRALTGSVKTLANQKKDKISHTPQGLFFGYRDTPGLLERFKIGAAFFAQNNPNCLQAAKLDIQAPEALVPTEFDLSGLNHLIALANQRHIELTFYFIPSHAYIQELNQQCAPQEIKWQAIKQIALAAEEFGSQAPSLWQFYGFNPVTTAPIETSATYWQDSTHYNFEMGNLMLADMFGTTGSRAPKTGRPVSSRHIDQDYRDFLNERTAYLRQHPDFQGNLRRLLP